jgi:hypothetical protein
MLFNELLESVNINPSDVRLLRHKDPRSNKGKAPYDLWHNDRDQFELYQSVQAFYKRKNLGSKYWASFVGTPEGDTMFVGLYEVEHRRVLEMDTPQPNMDGFDKAGKADRYDLSMVGALGKYVGKLYIAWEDGYHAWVQRADKQNKVITKNQN